MDSSSAVLQRLKSLANPDYAAGMARFGINPLHVLGISIPTLQKIAARIGKDHLLAERLWTSGVHEARILACMIDDPRTITELQMENWVKEFDSWGLCDQCCNRLFVKTRYAADKAVAWSERTEEFVRRAGFVMMAQLAIHDKKIHDSGLEQFFLRIKEGATDERNFVKKAVSWSLRQIGKRNAGLNQMAVEVALEIDQMDSRSAKWIARDTLKELKSDGVQHRLRP